MKKSLLIALAAVTAVSVNAQMRTQKAQPKAAPVAAQVEGIKGNAELRYAEQAQGPVVKKGPKKIGANKAKYYRPRGTFYFNWNSEGSGYVMPFLQAKPYQELTFTNASTAPTTGSTWTYQYYDYEQRARVMDEYAGVDFTYTWAHEYANECPVLTIPGVDSSYVCTQAVTLDRTTGLISKGPFFGELCSVVNNIDTYSNWEGDNRLANPHYYASSNREYTEKYGWTYYTGAPGPDYDPDAEPEQQDRSGHWFGRNWGEWNGHGMAVEQPNQPYVLNRVYGWVTALKGSEFSVNCRVYRLEEMPQYDDEASATVDPIMFDEDHLIATGSVTVTNEMIADGSPILAFDLYQYDPDLDMDIQVTPEIDFPIMIVMSGYDVEECQGLSFLVTTDEEDEGYGEFVYQFKCTEDGVITDCRGINNFFTSGEMKPGNSIFLDVSMPYLIYNFNNETGEYTFPNAGGKYSLNDHEGVNIYGDNATAETLYCSLEDGSDVPDWLTIELVDGTGDFEGTVDAKVTCAALPQGVEGRKAKVKFFYPGAYLIYTFIQGNPGDDPQPGVPGDVTGDGTVDIADVNAAINVMLGKEPASKYEGRADLTSDGTVDIADVNAVINAMLGK